METYLKKFGIEFKNKKIKLPKWCKRIKIDIGLSENAPQTRVWLENQSDLIVFGFEPVKDNFKKILRGTSKWTNKLNPANIGKRVYIINCALGNVEAPLKKKIYVTTKDKGCSSIYRPKYPKILKTEDVDVFSLDNFTELLPLDDFEFIEHIKTDCEGKDFDVVKSIGKYLHKVVFITSEMTDNRHHVIGSCDPNEFINFMKQNDFTVSKIYGGNIDFVNNRFINTDIIKTLNNNTLGF
jgi:FkbM family methyltransferase